MRDNPTYVARRNWIAACTIFAGAIAIRAFLVHAPVHDYDEGVYWQSLLSMQAGYAQYRDIFVSQPPVFLAVTYAFFAIFGKTLIAARIASMAGSLLTVACGAWVAFRIRGSLAGIVALIFLAIDKVDITEAVTLQAEPLAVGFATLSAALAFEWSHRTRGAAALAFAAGAVAAAAILVKFLAVACVVPFIVLAIAKRDVRGLALYATGAVVLGLALLIPYGAAYQEMIAQTVSFHLANVVLPASRYNTIAATTEVPLLLLALAGIAMAIVRRNICALSAAAWLAGAVVLLFKVTPLFPHHLDAVQAPLAILAAYGAAEFAAAARPVAAIATLAAVLAMNVWYAGSQVYTIYHPRAPRITESLIRHAVPQNGWIITDLQATAAAAGYTTPPDLVDTSIVRIRSGNLTAEQLIRDAGDARVRAVVFGGRRLSLPAVQPFVAWTHRHFHRTASPYVWTR